jgi:phenylpyruvate tautomerase
MPQLFVTVNVPYTKEQGLAFIKELSPKVAEILEKPEKLVAVQLTHNPTLIFGGSEEPCALALQCNVGEMDEAHNTRLSATLAAALEAHFKISKDRYFERFQGYAPHCMGFLGATIAALGAPPK